MLKVRNIMDLVFFSILYFLITTKYFLTFYLLIVLLGILESGADDFENSEDLYEAIGEILHEVSSNKSDDDIK